MTLSRMRRDFMADEMLDGRKQISDLDKSESTYSIVDQTYKDMEEFEERVKPKQLFGSHAIPAHY